MGYLLDRANQLEPPRPLCQQLSRTPSVRACSCASFVTLQLCDKAAPGQLCVGSL